MVLHICGYYKHAGSPRIMRFYFVLGDFFCMKGVNLSLKIKVNYSPKNVLWFYNCIDPSCADF